MFSDAFDKTKSDKNKAERGVDFIEARAIWQDPSVRQVEAKTVEGEVRYATIGLIDGKLWVAIWTDVSDLFAEPEIRIISVRRADGTKFERMYYDKG